MILAGSDTTATTLAFALGELSRHPDVAAAAAAEARSVLAAYGAGNGASGAGAAAAGGGGGGSTTTFDAAAVPADVYLTKLPLIAGIANETLRLYPAVTETGRVCVQVCVCVREGAGVGVGGGGLVCWIRCVESVCVGLGVGVQV